jgi:hypothetical protein
MSGAGQKRRFDRVRATSALLLKPDMAGSGCDVRLVPDSEVVMSFDHLVGTGKQRSWNLDAKLLRGLEVDE